jgi:UDP-N-acetylglucosamine 2-epimerase (non-hydrolysing)
MRETTKRLEGVEAETLKLVGPKTRDIVREATRLPGDSSAYAEVAKAANPYGDGRAANRTVDAFMNASKQV